MCLICESQLTPLDIHRYEDNFFCRHFLGRIELKTTAALYVFSKSGIVQNLIFDIKYNGNHHLARVMGQRLGALLREWENPPDFVVPVPLHRKRLRSRGFNQSAMIGHGICEVTGWKLKEDLLMRKAPTRSQTLMGRKGRWKNMRSAFYLTRKNNLEGLHILIVDDVMTTGATLEACAAVFREAEDVRISLCTLATGF